MARTLNVQVDIAGDAKKLERALRAAQAASKSAEGGLSGFGSKLSAVGDKMAQTGKTLSRRLTLPLVGVGVAAVKTFSDFESSIAKIGGLVLGSTEDLDQLRESVLKLSGETARSPQELADAMFAVQSAGLRGKEAYDALEVSAKAAAAGLGETKDIALAVAGAMTAYQAQGLKAAEATDILTATVKEGNLEAADLAGGMGKVISVAAAAGVSLNDLGALIAVITKQSVPASEAITQVSAAVKQLNAPTAEAIDPLEKVFGSLDNLRKMLAKDDGILVVFRQLRAELGDQPEVLRKVLGSSEALNAVLNVTGQEAKSVDASFQALNNSAGIVDNAFKIASETTDFDLKQALTDLSIAAIKAGGAIAPVASDILEKVSSLAEGFSNLDERTQKIILVAGGAAAALGPVLTVVGNLTKVTGGAITALERFGGFIRGTSAESATLRTKLGNLAVGVGAVTIAVAAATLAYQAYKKNKDEARAATDRLLEGIKREREGHKGLVDQLLVEDLVRSGTLKKLNEMGISTKTVIGAIKGESEARQVLDEQLQGLGPKYAVLRKTVDNLTAAHHAAVEAANLEERALRAIGNQAHVAARAYDTLIGRVQVFRNEAGHVSAVTGITPGLSARAHGGPVTEGDPYVVGERGPELFVPGVDGAIIPNQQSMALLRGQGTVNLGHDAGGGITIQNLNVDARGSDSKIEFETAVVNALARYLRRNRGQGRVREVLG